MDDLIFENFSPQIQTLIALWIVEKDLKTVINLMGTVKISDSKQMKEALINVQDEIKEFELIILGK